MLTTLGDCKASLALQNVAGAAITSPNYIARINEATRQLMRRGNWWGTVQPMAGCIYDNCIVWPRSVGSVLALNLRGNPVYLANHWFQFMQWDGNSSMMYHEWRQRGRRPWVSDSSGTLPFYRNTPPGMALFLRVYVDNPADVGTILTVWGYDSNTQELISVWPDGTTRPGYNISVGSNVNGTITAYTTTPILFSKVTRVLKQPTKGRVRLYWVDSNGVMIDAAVYEPDETNPDYVVNHVRTIRNLPSQLGTCCITSFQALVKLDYVPVKYDTDLVLIENIDALRDMVQSITYKEAGDIARSAAYERSAFRELNYEMRNRFPDEQVILNFRPFGNDSLNNWRTNIQMI